MNGRWPSKGQRPLLELSVANKTSSDLPLTSKQVYWTWVLCLAPSSMVLSKARVGEMSLPKRGWRALAREPLRSTI